MCRAAIYSACISAAAIGILHRTVLYCNASEASAVCRSRRSIDNHSIGWCDCPAEARCTRFLRLCTLSHSSCDMIGSCVFWNKYCSSWAVLFRLCSLKFVPTVLRRTVCPRYSCLSNMPLTVDIPHRLGLEYFCPLYCSGWYSFRRQMESESFSSVSFSAIARVLFPSLASKRYALQPRQQQDQRQALAYQTEHGYTHRNGTAATLAVLHTSIKNRTDFVTCILGIPFIHNVQEWSKVVVGRFVAVDAVVDCEEVDFFCGNRISV